MENKMGDRISIEDLFCAEFMKEYTDFESFLAFLRAGFGVGSLADFDAIPDSAFEKYVAKRTAFANWEEMLDRAKNHFIKKHIENQEKD